MKLSKVAIVIMILVFGLTSSSNALLFWNRDQKEENTQNVNEPSISKSAPDETKKKITFPRFSFFNKNKKADETKGVLIGTDETATDTTETDEKSIFSSLLFFKNEKTEDIEDLATDEPSQNLLSFVKVPFLKTITNEKEIVNTEDLEEGTTNFTEGYKYFEKEKYFIAAHHFYAFLTKHSPDDEEYEWAEFFFGISLDKLGLSHGSVDVLAQLVKRKPNPKITSYSLELFEEVTRSLPFDSDKIINQVLCDEEYGFVEQDLTDFINYHKGVFDWEHGFFEWGERHFGAISHDSYYYYKYLYQKTLLNIYKNEIDEAIANLKLILKGVPNEDRFKDEVRQTLARLLYEKEDYGTAKQLYQEIQTPVLEQAEQLLEKAWVQYRSGNYEKSMGLLYAFRAPCYKNYFTPEYFILKSFIYKGVCHYQEALSVIDDFNGYYGQSLNMIYNRDDVKANRMLLLVIVNKGQVKSLWEFLELLENEKNAVKAMPDSDLKDYLTRIYYLQMKKTTKEFKLRVQNEYEKMANSLLQYEEESHLLEYEIGLDMHQRVQQYHYKKDQNEVLKAKATNRTVEYPFQGEFWTYELDDYQVTLPNKCDCSEEWDVFFK